MKLRNIAIILPLMLNSISGLLAEHPHVDNKEIQQPKYVNEKLTFRNSNRPYSILNFRIFNEMNMSGSGQYTEDQFREIIKEIINRNRLGQGDVIVITDLRGEAHTFVGAPLPNTINPDSDQNAIISGQPINFIDSESREIISTSENTLIRALRGKTIKISPHRFAKEYIPNGEAVAKEDINIRINNTKDSRNYQIGDMETEAQMIRRVANDLGVDIKYVRIPIPDLSVPTLDHLFTFLNKIVKIEDQVKKYDKSKRVWVHIHCHGGLGRTGALMAALDMARTGKSLYQILDEQAKAGARNLLLTELPEIGQPLSDSQKVLDQVINLYLALHPEREDEVDAIKAALSKARTFNTQKPMTIIRDNVKNALNKKVLPDDNDDIDYSDVTPTLMEEEKVPENPETTPTSTNDKNPPNIQQPKNTQNPSNNNSW